MVLIARRTLLQAVLYAIAESEVGVRNKRRGLEGEDLPFSEED